MHLNNGVEIPNIGFGASIVPVKKDFKTYMLARKQKQIYLYAMKHGCKLFDISSSYGRSEEILGAAIKEYGRREDLFIMLKISNKEQREGDIGKVYARALETLNVEYVDLLMLHWPQTETYLSSWKQMEELYSAGKVRALGVSNFHKHHLEKLQENATVVPAVNQVEIHPLLTQKPLVKHCLDNGIRPMSYTPLGRMHDVLIKSKPIRALTKKYRKTAPQIILRWNLQLGQIPIPRTLSAEHFDEFMNIYDFKLTDEEVKWINGVNENIRLRYNPDTCDFAIL